MTYYGRWTYKFEEAARQGAAAALIIHDTEGAAYGWDVVKNSWSRRAVRPARGRRSGAAPAGAGLDHRRRRAALFADAGQDLDALYKAAGKRGFKADAAARPRRRST